MKQSMKRKIAMLLMASMIVPSGAFASDISAVNAADNTSAAGNSSAVQGSDVAGHWAEGDFATWFNKHLLTGYADGTFKPNQAITRAEFVVLLDRVFNFVDKASLSFSDLKSTDYSYAAFQKAVAAGIIQGYSDGSVHPNAPISRKEAAVMLYRGFELAASNAATSLSDVASLPAWSKEAVETLVNDGYVNGYPDGTFGGDKSITRAEAIRMMNNLSGEIVNAAGTYSDLTTRNMVISKPGVVLEDTVIEGDLFLTAGVGEGDVDLNRVTVKGQVHINGGGVNSIKLNDSTIKSIIIDKKNGQIRVVTKGDTTVEQTFVISGAKLVEENDADGKGFSSVILDESMSAGATVQLEGNFDNVDVRALTTPELQLLAGIINNLNLQQQAVLNIDEKGEVKEVVIKVDGSIQVKGSGKVNASDPKSAAKLVFQNGTGSTGETGNTGSTGGTGSSGSGSSGSVTLPVAVTQVALDQREDFGLLVGDVKSLTATVSPANAADKSLQWSSSNKEVATVDSQGKVTAVAPGTAVIQAQSKSNSTLSDSVTVTVTKPSFTNVSVHDPSIAVDKDTGEFYVFGSHIEAAKSSDLMNWTRFTNGYTTPENVLFGNLSENLHGSFAWAGENDADSKGGFSVWAPYVFYNKDYDNGDGTTGAYVMYYCTSATYIRSAIGYAVSQNIEGPYTYVDTIMYSGFTQNDATDANSTVNKNWQNTNIQNLIDGGTLQGENNGWFNTDGSYKNSQYPNAIDPALYYDTDGKLWMVYGSWSGGIFALEIDKATGEAIYPGADGTTEDGRMIDRYFGTKVAGGYGKSGEGPFVVYDENTGYYFLNVTYGGLASDGGYNMRMFRSTSPTGPFLDAKGQSAVLPNSSANNDDYGNKMIGNYEFERLPGDPGTGDGIGYLSPGHNSVYIDEETGQYFLIFHSRFPNQGEGHEVRVHQMFLNEDNWPIVSPYRYSGEKLDQVVEQDIVGEYKFINHGKTTTKDLTTSTFVQLNANHTVTGDEQGTWSLSGDNEATITVGGATYKGVFVREWDGTSQRGVMTFTAMSGEGITIWGSKLQDETEQQVVSDVVNGIDLGDTTNVVSDLSLPTEGTRHTTITWQTSNASIVSETGAVTRPEWDEPSGAVELTATVTKGSTTATKTFTVTVPPKIKATMTANYTFDGNLDDSTGTFAAGTVAGNLIGAAGGNITFAAGYKGNAAVFDGASGVMLPSGLIHSNKYSFSFWMKPDVLTQYTTAFFGATDGDSWISMQPKGWNGGTMLWARDLSATNDQWFDGITGTTIPTGEWSHIAVSVEDGAVIIYVNGVKTFTASNFPDLFSNADGTFTLGINWWDTPFKGMIDDLRIYEGVLSPNEVRDMVYDDTVKIDSITFGVTEKRMSVGSTFTPTINFEPKFVENKVLDWSSSNSDVAIVDSTGAVTALQVGSTTITAKTTDGSEKTASYTVTVTDGAIAQYKFEGNLNDSFSSSTGTVTGNRIDNTGGNITFDTGVTSSSQAAVFNGTSGIRLPNGLISGNSYSVSMSLYLTQESQYTTAFFGALSGTEWISLIPRGTGDAQPTQLWANKNIANSPYYNDAQIGEQIPLNQWVTITFTVNNGTVVIYVDGVAKVTGTNFPNIFTTDNGLFALGVNYWDAPFKGKIDELQVYDRALTADEVQALQPVEEVPVP
ncbi:beta-xylosidase [Paenibacillus cellulosilyticus]|uniref:Beta-xylosidase n=1 Tax=Paenibacillus cellulosilyticus TaxID=375489 RepID=A0A2V2YYE7_9BACL|nr:LamG-like jellyroll fold domain-containing protein [Paenibacillus cellulosilyticus]PWW07160.1 beta-xylosidase [Paenibacillus cellulosilyticus]QKS44636.1 S-layer homology domain-containing protein [Paenibacillus cellulosilyticus]